MHIKLYRMLMFQFCFVLFSNEMITCKVMWVSKRGGGEEVSCEQNNDDYKVMLHFVFFSGRV